MKNLITALCLLLGAAYQGFAQSTAKSPCNRYDDRAAITAGNAQAVYYIEVCTVPNQEGKPALSVVFSSIPDRKEAMRIYSNAAGKPLSLDGIYVERRGQKQFILHRSEIEWANGTRTQLETLDPKKKKKLEEVVAAAFQLLKMAAQNRRIANANSNDQERLYRNIVFDFMFKYQLGAKD
jgi:hypothetical protein